MATSTALRPVALRLGCSRELEGVLRILALGSSAERQLRLVERGASPEDIVRIAAAELEHNVRLTIDERRNPVALEEPVAPRSPVTYARHELGHRVPGKPGPRARGSLPVLRSGFVPFPARRPKFHDMEVSFLG